MKTRSLSRTLFRRVASFHWWRLSFVWCLMVVSYIGLVEAQSVGLLLTEDHGYEDWHTFKHGKAYTQDPYEWVYTREFSKKFGMPDKWVDDNLKGALAIAFRMTTTGNTTCGLAGREDNCWPSLQCQLDVYYDNHIRLPWMHEEIVQDFLLRGVSSSEFLYDLSDSKGIRRYLPKDGKGIPRVLATEGVITVGKYKSGFASVAYFDREYQPGVGLIGWVGIGVCPKPVGTGHISFYDLDTERQISHMQIKRESATPMHVIELPESFMRRANTVYQRDSKRNTEVAQRLMQQFIESKPSQKQSD